MYLCTKHVAKQGGSGGMLPQEILMLNLLFDAISGIWDCFRTNIMGGKPYHALTVLSVKLPAHSMPLWRSILKVINDYKYDPTILQWATRLGEYYVITTACSLCSSLIVSYLQSENVTEKITSTMHDRQVNGSVNHFLSEVKVVQR